MKSTTPEPIGHPAMAGWHRPVSLCLGLLAGGVFAQDTSIVKNDTDTSAPAAQVLKTDEEKLSYAMGMNMGMNVQKQIKRDGLEVNSTLFIQALHDTLLGYEPLLTTNEASAILVGKRAEMTAQQERARKELASRNQKEEEAFLAKNKAEAGVVTLESGLQYKVLKAGEGAKPKPDDTVRCEYRGTLLDGTEIDSTTRRGGAASLVLRQLIDGWREALELMPVGSKWQIVIPSRLAYREHGAGRLIGPNAALLFEVELLGVNEAPKTVASRPASGEALAGVPHSDASPAQVTQ
ncbi:MAG TPA: FKBP-type peptidyl-prolyl cis-trans isomerase [Verrucomicrobiae bacterium]